MYELLAGAVFIVCCIMYMNQFEFRSAYRLSDPLTAQVKLPQCMFFFPLSKILWCRCLGYLFNCLVTLCVRARYVQIYGRVCNVYSHLPGHLARIQTIALSYTLSPWVTGWLFRVFLPYIKMAMVFLCSLFLENSNNSFWAPMGVHIYTRLLSTTHFILFHFISAFSLFSSSLNKNRVLVIDSYSYIQCVTLKIGSKASFTSFLCTHCVFSFVFVLYILSIFLSLFFFFCCASCSLLFMLFMLCFFVFSRKLSGAAFTSQ